MNNNNLIALLNVICCKCQNEYSFLNSFPKFTCGIYLFLQFIVNLFRQNINVSASLAKIKLTLFTNMILHNVCK